jgi:hypothetical protein
MGLMTMNRFELRNIFVIQNSRYTAARRDHKNAIKIGLKNKRLYYIGRALEGFWGRLSFTERAAVIFGLSILYDRKGTSTLIVAFDVLLMYF